MQKTDPMKALTGSEDHNREYFCQDPVTYGNYFIKQLGKKTNKEREISEAEQSVLGSCFYNLFRDLEAMRGNRREANELLALRPEPVPRGDCWILSHTARRDNVIYRKNFFLVSNSPTKLHHSSKTLFKHLNMFWGSNFVHTQENIRGP